jgi:hypothetical protein
VQAVAGAQHDRGTAEEAHRGFASGGGVRQPARLLEHVGADHPVVNA